jgi:hypothetical protein
MKYFSNNVMLHFQVEFANVKWKMENENKNSRETLSCSRLSPASCLLLLPSASWPLLPALAVTVRNHRTEPALILR